MKRKNLTLTYGKIDNFKQPMCSPDSAFGVDLKKSGFFYIGRIVLRGDIVNQNMRLGKNTLYVR